jgi:repressor LexA
LNKLTPTQKDVLSAIKARIKKDGWPPTRMELAVDLLISPNAVQDHIVALTKKKAISVAPGVSRGIRVL